MEHHFPRRLEVLKDIYRVKSLAVMEDGEVNLISADRLTPRFAKGSILELRNINSIKKGVAIYKSTGNRKRWFLRAKPLERCIQQGVLQVLEH